MKVRFWGTRGSLAKPGPSTIRYGGNTSCVEVTTDAGELLIIDCGTGAHELGQRLQRESGGPVRGNLLISHTHWDHIQGIPFFAPFFVPGNEWDIYAPQGFGETLRATLAGQMEYTYFPITPDAFGATLRYHNVSEGVFQIGSARIITRYLNHPALTVAYRIEADGAAIVYACDHEPHSHGAAVASEELHGQDALHAEFLSGADLVIHDAQYLAAEYPAKEGWGHSTVEYAVRVCERAGARRLALTHHDPMRDDEAVDCLVADATKFRRGQDLEIIAAAEGWQFDIHDSNAPALMVQDQASAAPERSGQTVLVVSEDDDLLNRIVAAVEDEGLGVVSAATMGMAATLAAAGRPPLVVVDGALPGHAVAAIIGAVGDTPTVVIGGEDCPTAPNVERIAANFSREYFRSRVRTWLMRGKFSAVPAAMTEAESERLAALRSLQLLDTPPEERFDRLTRLAATIFSVPMSTITLVDEDRQWFKSRVGLEDTQTSREVSFCTHALREIEPLVVTDALQDARFADNPLVVGPPRIRFYAGAPIYAGDQPVGTLCLIDTKPRSPSPQDIQLLKDIAKIVQVEIDRSAKAQTRAGSSS